MKLLTFLLIGMIFGAGITLSGMINPAKIFNFFDIAGDWDPSLAFVMGGALLVTTLGYRFVLRRKSPLMDDEFHLPSRKDIDPSLIGGAGLFGIGWGIAGFCPGGALPALGLGQMDAFIFVFAMCAGLWAMRRLRTKG